MEKQARGCPLFKLFTIGTTTLSLFIVNFVFLADAWENPSLYPKYYSVFFSIIFTSLYILWTWSYIIAISCNTKVPRSAIVLPSNGRCEKCRINKPDRAHHCSQCDLCVEKMDHHCVWTDRCIGYHNYKSFLLFVGYLSLGTFFYDYLAIRFFMREKVNFGVFTILLVYIESAIVLLATLLANILFLAHVLMASTNLSTIEYMQGKPFRFFWGENKEPKNVHDLGVVQNLVQIFGLNPFMWFIPSVVEEREAGIVFPKIPEQI